MTLSDELQDMAGELVMVSADIHQRLCRATMEARRLERIEECADEIVANAQADEVLVQKARRLSSVEWLTRR